jgi:predicted nucleic acid-binding protein
MYCLDTNIVIYYQNNNEIVVNKLLSVDEGKICISHITRIELFYGAFKSRRTEENLALQTEFCDEVNIINSSSNSDIIFAQIKSKLKKSGQIVADLDLMIASICLANNLILVTNNIKDFKNIPDLKIEDWSK